MAYCNTTTDLADLISGLGIDFQEKKQLPEDWTQASGQTNTYQIEGVGYWEMAFDDGVQMTTQTSIANVESNAGSFYYDTDNDVLYVHTFGSDDLTSSPPTIHVGLDWDSAKTDAVNDAAQEIDSYINKVVSTPVLPRLIKTHGTADYEAPLRRSNAALAIRNLIIRRYPDKANQIEKIAVNSNPDVGEEKGYINKIVDGDIYLQEMISPREVGNFNVYPKSDNTATAYVWVLGKYTGSSYERWRVQIDTAGAPGTATYKLSYDTGTNWDKTLQETFDTDDDDRRISIGSGLYLVFYGTFAEGDYWDIELFPQSDTATHSKFGGVTLRR